MRYISTQSCNLPFFKEIQATPGQLCHERDIQVQPGPENVMCEQGPQTGIAGTLASCSPQTSRDGLCGDGNINCDDAVQFKIEERQYDANRIEEYDCIAPLVTEGCKAQTMDQNTTEHLTSLTIREKSTAEYSSAEYATDPDDEDTIIVQPKSVGGNGFACPYYVMNQDKYASCLNIGNISDIWDLVEHIDLVHRRPFYCPICGNQYETAMDRDSHILLRSCRQIALPGIDGVSFTQFQEIYDSLTSQQAKQFQWYLIWDILFPGQKQPEVIYLDEKVGAKSCTF